MPDVSAKGGFVLAGRATATIKVAANRGDLSTVIGSGFSTKWPFWFTQVPNGVVILTNGIDPMQRWDTATGILEVAGVPAPATSPTVAILTGTTSAQASGAFIYAFVRFYDNYGNISDLSPIGEGVSGYSLVSSVTYTNVATPAPPYGQKVVGRQILRNTPGQATVFYVDLDTRDLTSTTFTSYQSDPVVSAQEAVPLLTTTGGILANTHGFPPDWKAAAASYLGRVFATGEVVYNVGNVIVTSGSTTVQGVGTKWPANFGGRSLYISSPPGVYAIATVDPVAQTLTLSGAYNGPTDHFAIYGIRASSAEWRNVYYTPTAEPESWPASYALSLQDDGDEIVGLMPLGSFLYILEQRHIYRLTFLSDPAIDGAIFLSSRRGCLSQRMWVQAEATAYLFDQLGVHSFSGGNSTPISDSIQDLWRDNGNSSLVINWNADTSLWSSSYNATHTTIRFFVAMTGSRYPRHALCYNYRQNKWWIEEYPRPICSTTLMPISALYYTVAGMDANTISGLDVGYMDGSRGLVPTVSGTVTSATPCSITDLSANYTQDVVNLTVSITKGRAKGYSRRIVNVTNLESEADVSVAIGGTRLALETPWTVRPRAGDTYKIGAIPWRYQPGWFSLLDDADMQSARDVEIFFQPLQEGDIDLQVFYDRSNQARVWVTNRKGTTTVVAGDDRVEFDMSTPGGWGVFRLEGHCDRYLTGDAYISPQLSGFQHREQIRIYRMNIHGCTQESSGGAQPPT